MQKKIYLLLSLWMVLQNAFAQSDIHGTIKSETGVAIENATVALKGTNHLTFSDKNGKFSFFNLKAATATLVVNHLGFYEYTRELPLTGNQQIEIVLFKKPIVTDEVLIQAVKLSNRLPGAENKLNKQALESNNNGKDVPQLLDLLPGVVITSDAGTGIGYSGLRMRGSDATRINVTINNIPVNDAESHALYWVDMPDLISSTDEITIQRGVGTSESGAASFGGNINLITDKLQDHAYAESNLSYGSFNTKKANFKTSTGFINNHFSFETRLSTIQSSGYIDRASSDLKSFYLSGGYFGTSSMLKFIMFSGKEITYQAWNGVPESRYKNDINGMNDYINRNGLDEEDAANLLNSGRTYNAYTYKNQIDHYQQDNYQIHFSHHVTPLLSLNIATHLTRGLGYYEEYKKNDRLSSYGISDVVIGDTIISRSNLVRRKWLDNYFYGFVYSLSYQKKNIEIKTGGGWNQYDGDHYGTLVWVNFMNDSLADKKYYFNNGLKTDYNHWIKTWYRFNYSWAAYFDLQYRFVSYRFTGFDQNFYNKRQLAEFNFINPKAGITFKRNEQENGWILIGIANKEPSRDDFTESTPASRPKHENLTDFEVGYEKQYSNFNVRINYYYMYYHNQLVLTGKVNDVGNYTRLNVPSSYRTGLEAEVNVKAGQRWLFQGNVSWNKNIIPRFEEYVDQYDIDFNYIGQKQLLYKNTTIAFSPEWIAAGSLEYAPFNNLKFSIAEKYVGKQFLDNTSSAHKVINAFAYTNVSLRWSTKLFKYIKSDLSLTVYNLFNTMYASNGYTYGYYYNNNRVDETFYYPQGGTHYLLSAKIRF